MCRDFSCAVSGSAFDRRCVGSWPTTTHLAAREKPPMFSEYEFRCLVTDQQVTYKSPSFEFFETCCLLFGTLSALLIRSKFFVFAAYGCCQDGAMPALGPNYKGCPGESALFFSKTSRDYIENNSNKNHLDKQQRR